MISSRVCRRVGFSKAFYDVTSVPKVLREAVAIGNMTGTFTVAN